MRVILAAVLVVLTGCQGEDPGATDGGVEDSGAPDTGPLTCEQCLAAGVCVVGLQGLCPGQGACDSQDEDGGRQGHLSCYENGVVRYEVHGGSVPWMGKDVTVYGPDGAACYVMQERSHWKPHNVPPGSPTRTVTYQLADGGSMAVSTGAQYLSVECNGRSLTLPPGCEQCLGTPNVTRPSCRSGTCQRP